MLCNTKNTILEYIYQKKSTHKVHALKIHDIYIYKIINIEFYSVKIDVNYRDSKSFFILLWIFNANIINHYNNNIRKQKHSEV